MREEKVLIIEDDPTMLRGLKDNFRFKGYQVSAVDDGQEGLDTALSEHPDIVILDIMLPNLDGYQICSALRAEGREMPIIMLTAKGNESDIIRGLNLGANDYMTKPFSIKELLARAEGLLERSRRDLPEVFQFGSCSFNFSSHKLYRDGDEVMLTPKESGLLKFFIRHSSRALTREIIMDNVWGRDLVVTPRSVDRCINTLRNKVEPDPPQPTFIKTIRDIGYRFDIEEVSTEFPGMILPDSQELKPLALGRKLGSYEITAKMDESLFEGRTADGELVWIHTPSWLNDEAFWNVCREEGRSLLDCGCSGMVPLKAFSRIAGHSCVVTERPVGLSLNQLIKQGPISTESIASIGLAISGTLAEMEARGVRHYHLAPDQIFIEGKKIQILGYGQAKAREAFAEKEGGLAMLSLGDLRYMAPEQLTGQVLDNRTDIFALGCILVTLAMGEASFANLTPAETIASILRDPPPDLTAMGFPKMLNRVVAHCLEKSPVKRFQSATDLGFALEGIE